MRVRILGSAAGGGFPQWNCGCGNCTALRQSKFKGKPRTQSQLAVTADDRHWYLAGASPNLSSQIESFPALHPRAPRDSPISGVVLASADLDHVLGLLSLRELQPLRVYGTGSVLKVLREENSTFGMLNRVEPQVSWNAADCGAEFPLVTATGEDTGLRCRMLCLSGRYPSYVKAAGLGSCQAVAGLFFTAAGKRVAYFPAVGALDSALIGAFEGVDLLLLDGTFWADDELIRVQGSGQTAQQMGHIPVKDTLAKLRNLAVGRKMFIHVNNTNPILNEASEEYRAVRDAGWQVAEDGWQVDL
jgi:pyrroloquinoline quinone biosynthesis protein B